MMNRKILDIVRLFLISPEFFVLVLFWDLFSLYPKPMILLGSEIVREGSMVQYIALLPVALLTMAYSLSKDALRPLDGDKNRLLYEWPEYWRLKFRALAALFFCLVASAGSIGLWVFKMLLAPSLLGVGFAAAVVLALVSTTSLYLGYLRLREILQGGS